MIGNRLNIGSKLCDYYEERYYKNDYFSVLDGKLFVFGTMYANMEEITSSKDHISVSPQQATEVEERGYFVDHDTDVMYYNGLVDTMYDVFEWMICKKTFIKAYVTLDKRIIIEYGNKLHRWFIVEDTLGYTAYVERSVYKDNIYIVQHSIIVDGFNYFMYNSNCRGKSHHPNTTLDSYLSNVLGVGSSVIYVTGDIIRAKDIKLKLTDTYFVNKRHTGLFDVLLVTMN